MWGTHSLACLFKAISLYQMCQRWGGVVAIWLWSMHFVISSILKTAFLLLFTASSHLECDCFLALIRLWRERKNPLGDMMFQHLKTSVHVMSFWFVSVLLIWCLCSTRNTKSPKKFFWCFLFSENLGWFSVCLPVKSIYCYFRLWLG